MATDDRRMATRAREERGVAARAPEPTPGRTATSRRLLAFTLDVLIATLVVWIGAALLAALLGPTVTIDSEAATVGVDPRGAIATTLVGLTLSAAYFVVPWVTSGASAGQHALKLRVTDRRSGRRLTVWRATLRWLLLFPPFTAIAALAADVTAVGVVISVIAPAWYVALLATTLRSPVRQGLHDRIAGSAVRPRTEVGGVR